MTGAERAAKRRMDPAKREADNLKRRLARSLQASQMSVEEKENKRVEDRIRKTHSRMNQSRQKKVGTKLKEMKECRKRESSRFW